MARLRNPKPGIYYDVPFSQYQSWPSINNSSLGPALKSGRHYAAAIEGARHPPTAQMVLGSLVHSLVLEPDRFEERFAVVPDFSDKLSFSYREPSRSDEYKGLLARWTKKQKGKVIVSAEQFQLAQLCSESIMEEVGYFMWSDAVRDNPDQIELSVVSKCAETKLRLKGRLDIVLDDRIVDLKTTHDAGNFEMEIDRYGYYRQAAFYQDLLAPHIGNQILPVWLVAVETSPPFAVRAAPLDGAAICVGRAEYMRAVRAIARGLESGTWDGYARVAKWRLPPDRHVVDLRVGNQDVEVSG